MTSSFRELREAARARLAHVSKLFGERLSDPHLKVVVRRDGFAPGQSTVNLSITLQCTTMIPDEAGDALIREMAVIAYGTLGSYAHQHFMKHVVEQPPKGAPS